MVSETCGDAANGKDASAEMGKPEDNATKFVLGDLIFESDEESFTALRSQISIFSIVAR